MSDWAWLFSCFCSRYHGYLLIYLSRAECWLFAHFTQTLFESRLWNGWHCISYTTNTKASPSNETRKATSLHLECTFLLWERDESNTTAMYHHRFGYTLWERNKHNIEEMKNKHKYKTLIKIRNIVNNMFYPFTVAWRKNSWAEQVSFVWCMSIWASRMGECWLVLWHSQDSAELTSNDGTELGRSTYRTVLRVLANSEHTQKWDGLQTLPQSAILAVWAIL